MCKPRTVVEPRWIVAGSAADVIIVSARTSGSTRDASGITLFAVDAKQAGVQRANYRTVDGMHAANLVLEGVKVSRDDIVGSIDQGLPLLEAAGAETTIAKAASALKVQLSRSGRTIGQSAIQNHGGTRSCSKAIVDAHVPVSERSRHVPATKLHLGPEH